MDTQELKNFFACGALQIFDLATQYLYKSYLLVALGKVKLRYTQV